MTESETLPLALFAPTGDGAFRATELARGPWDPRALHGGPPAALLATALVDAIADSGLGVEMFPARFTAELLAPVPLDELRITTDVRRPGKRICVVDGVVSTPDGTPCLTGTLAAIRHQPFERAVDDEPSPPDPPAKGRRAQMAGDTDQIMFARDGVEHRVVAGRFESPGPATDWIRLVRPLVEGRPLSPLERVVAAADFGNGVSKWFEMGEVLFVNPDLTVHLHRLPVGEWICLQATTRLGPDGVGMAESLLFDEDGPIGRSVQSLLVEDRERGR